MESLVIMLLVALRIAATTWANVQQKRLLDPAALQPLALVVAVWSWMTLLTVPWWLHTFDLGYRFWGWMLLTCLLEVPGNVLLLRSLQQTELSVFGPLSSSKPAISLALALLLFGQVAGLLGSIGVAVVILGSIVLTWNPNTDEQTSISRRRRRAGIRDRLLAVVLTAAASVFLKQALEEQPASQTLAAWCLLSWLLAALWQLLSAAATRTRSHTAESNALGTVRTIEESTSGSPSRTTLQTEPLTRLTKQVSPTIAQVVRKQQRAHRAVFMIAVAMLAMQFCTIVLFERMPVGYALALFQLGSLVSVVVGHRFFGEAQLVQRLIAASIMVLGAVMVILEAPAR